MKKIIYIIVLLFGISNSTFSQPSEGDFEIGLGFGYNAANIFYTDGIGGITDGFNFTASADYYFSNSWSLKTKLIYDQKGWNGIYDFYVDEYTENSLPYAKYDLPFQLNYLTVPIMANWHFSKRKIWYLNFGPYLGFLLNAENKYNGNSIEQDLNSIDIGIAFGIGVKIPINNNLKVYFELDRQNGFKNIFDNNYNYNNNYFYEDDFGLNMRGSLNFGFIYQFDKDKPAQK